MPWESRTVEDQRTEFAQAAMSCRNFSALCREYGITRRTGLKWKARYEAQETMSDRSRRPKHSPTRTPEDVEQQIVRSARIIRVGARRRSARSWKTMACTDCPV